MNHVLGLRSQHTLMLLSRFLLVVILLFSACTQSNQKTPTSLLPDLTGPFKVGTTILHLTDSTRMDPLLYESNQLYEMMVQVWYPAEEVAQSQRSSYLHPIALSEAMKKDGYLNLDVDVIDGWLKLTSHANLNAPPRLENEKFPLLVFSPGFGMSRINYTTIIEELVSHGYVVAAIDHPYSGLTVFPNQRVVSFSNMPPKDQDPDISVEVLSKDALFVVNWLLKEKGEVGRFASYIDQEQIGMFGHSLGGAAALDACRVYEQFRACVNLDGHPFGEVEQEGVKHAYLALLQAPGGPIEIPESMRNERDSLWTAIVSKQASDGYVLKVEGTSHFNFSDLPFIVPDSLLKRNGGVIEPHRLHTIVSDILRVFFSQHLTGKAEEPIQSVVERYAEVVAIVLPGS